MMYAPAQTETTSTGKPGPEQTVDLRERRRSGLIPFFAGMGYGAAMTALLFWIIS